MPEIDFFRDVADGARTVKATADKLQLRAEEVTTAHTKGERLFVITGTLNGVSLRSAVSVVEVSLSFSADTQCTLSPSLGIGIQLSTARERLDPTDTLHLPEAWARLVDPQVWGAPRKAVSSSDPCLSRALLETIDVDMGHLRNLHSLTDDELQTTLSMAAKKSSLEEHWRASTQLAEKFMRAAKTFDPRDHDALPSAAWTPVVRDLGGELVLAEGRYFCELDGAQLDLFANWGDGRYSLIGELTWASPFPLDELDVSSHGRDSWLNRWINGGLELGDDTFDRTFFVKATPPDKCLQLFNDDLRATALGLRALVEDMSWTHEFARFEIKVPPTDPNATLALVGACRDLSEAVQQALRPKRSAYR